MPGLVALTGATGFIGREILRNLVSNGYHVRALARKPRKDEVSIHWILGDLNNKTALHQLVEGVDAVIHCAGSVRGSSLEEFVRTNVDGTSNLVHAAEQQAIAPRFLLISSLAAREPKLSWYAKSKQMAEQYVIDYAAKDQWIVLRPTAVYGQGDKELKPVFNATRHGLLPLVGEVSNKISLLHVDDFVAAIQCWLSMRVPASGVYELDDGNVGGYSYESIAAITQEVWGRSVRCIKVPISLVRLVAQTNLTLAKLFHYSPMLTPKKVKELEHSNWLCDNTPLLKAMPGWEPKISLREALPQLF
ncbi:MAG: NAD-dependent epimerase/dehydratase family protein [Nitrosomonas sp.]|nr:NAD-dependent epimerase/dehydratase family protein [Nitrosomonas sp.]